MRSFLLLAALAGAVTGDSNIVLSPPANATGPKVLLVWVPGGNVNNTAYEPVLTRMQAELSGSVSLWVSIAACVEHLCVPVFTTTKAITTALQNGQDKSGVTDAKSTWMGGHSLGGVAADKYAQKNAATVGGGCILWGAYVAHGPAEMLAYPVPVLQLVAELDYGSARLTKMAPYYAAAATKADQFARTPVIVQPRIDHSDFDAHKPDVPGDLPSASALDDAVAAIAATSTEFMRQHVVGAAPSSSWAALVAGSKEFFDPVNAALALEHSGEWCATVQRAIAGADLSAKISVTASAERFTINGNWPAPNASAAGGKVDVSVVGRNTYEDFGKWPPTLRAGAAAGIVPEVKRNSAMPLGCRMISRAKIASLLGAGNVTEPAGACKAANQQAWQYAVANAPAHILARYNSSAPCNGCKPAVPVKFAEDMPLADASAFSDASLMYVLAATDLTVAATALTSGGEHSCMLFGPARALDFLYFDAYTASCY